MADKTYPCDLCSQGPFKAPTALGRHKLSAHGIPGKSSSSVSYRKQKEMLNGKQSGTEPHEPKNETKKSKTLAGSKTAIQKVNHHKQPNNGDAIPEGALAVAFGRFQGLCLSFAYEYDLPPKLFTTRLTQLISASAVR